MIAADLRAKGRPIPANDAWIAAQVMETGAALISADRQAFKANHCSETGSGAYGYSCFDK